MPEAAKCISCLSCSECQVAADEEVALAEAVAVMAEDIERTNALEADEELAWAEARARFKDQQPRVSSRPRRF
eukprot:7138189-Alexandrium_andersonii.AAC.1